MEKSSKLGINKTGIDMSPKQTKDMLDTEGLLMAVSKDSNELEALHRHHLQEADPLGSVPLPGTVKGVAKSTMKMISGKHPEVFINKLGERLAYERSGVRIYEQLIEKCKHSNVSGDQGNSIPIKRMEAFRDQEKEHFLMLVDCMKQLGADPTAQTPDADASSVATSGPMKVILDPRASISQSLEAMLIVELTDNASWELLVELANDMSLPDMAKKFEHALAQETHHLEEVRRWYEESVREQVMVV